MVNLKFSFNEINLTSYGRNTIYSPEIIYGRDLIDRIHFINRGNEYLTFKGKEYILVPGVFYFLPHHLKYEIRYDNEGCDHSYVDFIPSRPVSCDSWIKFEKDEYPLFYKTLQLIFTFAEKFPKLDTIGNLYYNSIISTYMLCFLDMLDKENILHPLDDSIINLAFDYIHQNFQNEMSVKELSELVHMEINSFIRYFKRFTSYTPYYYIKLHRFNIASNLIEQGRSVTDVAYLLGYSSVANFSKAFNKHFGYYPSRIKKQDN